MTEGRHWLQVQDWELSADWRLCASLFDLVPCLVTFQDRNFRLLSYNQRFAEKFAPKSGDYCYKAYKNREEKCEHCPVELTFQTGRSHCSEENGYVQDGTEANWLVTTAPVCNEQGQIEAVMEICQDITDKRRLEEDLRVSEQRYWAVFNNIPNPVFVLDVYDLKVLDSNDQVSSVFGYTQQELLQMSFLDLFLEKDRAYYQKLLPSTRYISQARQQIKDGRFIYTAIRISPSEYMGQQVYLVSSTDITQRLETEQKLIQASKMTTLGEMASGVAHELNQTLAVIKTAGNYLQKKSAQGAALDNETARSMLEEIDSNVDRAGKIITHLREFSRKPDLELEPVQLNRVIHRALELFSQQLKLREIEICCDLQEGLPQVLAEPVQLEQVVINLLLNARDAIEQKNAESSPGQRQKQIRIFSRQCKNELQVCIQDTGCGIPRGIRDRIFEPFFTTKEVGSGTGLGLSISYRIVQDCLGKIEVESGEGQGASFLLTFPVLQGQQKGV